MHAKKRREALRYHRALPQGVSFQLKEYGILDSLIYARLLGWHDERLMVPIFNRHGDIACFEQYVAVDDGFLLDEERSRVAWEIYGWDSLRLKPRQVVICEGSLERLVLGSRAFHAISIVGFPRSLKSEWLPFFEGISEVFVCFRRREVSTLAAETLTQLLPQARMVELPASVGDGGGLHDFFARLQHPRTDFLDLLENARHGREAA